MRIRKNGKVISLTESDLMRITRKVLREQDETKTPKFSLMNLGMDGSVLERILSKLAQDYNPKEDKHGTYIFLNPSDFDRYRIEDVFGFPSKEAKGAEKIADSLVSAGLIKTKPGEDYAAGTQPVYEFGPKGKQNFQLYFKKAKKEKF